MCLHYVSIDRIFYQSRFVSEYARKKKLKSRSPWVTEFFLVRYRRTYIRKNDKLVPQSIISPLGTGNIISSHLRMWKYLSSPIFQIIAHNLLCLIFCISSLLPYLVALLLYFIVIALPTIAIEAKLIGVTLFFAIDFKIEIERQQRH